MRNMLAGYRGTLQVIDETGTGAEALAKIEEKLPDLVILNIQMPGRLRNSIYLKGLKELILQFQSTPRPRFLPSLQATGS